MDLIGTDDGNREKCRKHGLSETKIEYFFHQEELFIGPDIQHSAYEERFYAVGRMPSGKPGLVIFAYREGYIRPISARYMHEEENERYQKIAAKTSR